MKEERGEWMKEYHIVEMGEIKEKEIVKRKKRGERKEIGKEKK